MLLPEVIVGGYPRSGTSFLCSLIARMGYWPGIYSNLVGANEFNKLGYWEYFPIRELAWGLAAYHANNGIIYTKPETIPHETLELADTEVAEQISGIAKRDNVEVYKDNALPILYTLYPKDSKYIIIRRNKEAVYQSILKFERMPHSLVVIQDGAFWGIPRENVYQAIDVYRNLEQAMSERVSCLFVYYEDFGTDFDAQLCKIVKFLGIDMDKLNMEKLRSVYCVRNDVKD